MTLYLRCRKIHNEFDPAVHYSRGGDKTHLSLMYWTNRHSDNLFRQATNIYEFIGSGHCQNLNFIKKNIHLVTY